jgi:hypothetical protein
VTSGSPPETRSPCRVIASWLLRQTQHAQSVQRGATRSGPDGTQPCHHGANSPARRRRPRGRRCPQPCDATVTRPGDGPMSQAGRFWRGTGWRWPGTPAARVRIGPVPLPHWAACGARASGRGGRPLGGHRGPAGDGRARRRGASLLVVIAGNVLVSLPGPAIAYAMAPTPTSTPSGSAGQGAPAVGPGHAGHRAVHDQQHRVE